MTVQSDLLPVSVRNRRSLVSSLKCWATVWVLILLATFYVCLGQNRLMKNLETTAARADAQANPLRKVQAEERRMRKQITEIRKRESWLTESDSGQTLQLLGVVSRAARENHGRINVETLKVREIERALESPKPAANRRSKTKQKVAVEKKMQLDLNGIAVDDLAVASFVAVLREAGVFESVELKSTLSEIVSNHETRKYEVSCLY